MLSAGMEAKARETVVRFAWYVERAKVKKWNGGWGMAWRCDFLEGGW